MMEDDYGGQHNDTTYSKFRVTAKSRNQTNMANLYAPNNVSRTVRQDDYGLISNDSITILKNNVDEDRDSLFGDEPLDVLKKQLKRLDKLSKT